MLSFFGLMHFPSSGSPERKGLFDCLFSEIKKRPFAAFLRNSSQNRKNVHKFLHFHKFCLNFTGKDEVFQGLLCSTCKYMYHRWTRSKMPKVCVVTFPKWFGVGRVLTAQTVREINKKSVWLPKEQRGTVGQVHFRGAGGVRILSGVCILLGVRNKKSTRGTINHPLFPWSYITYYCFASASQCCVPNN